MNRLTQAQKDHRNRRRGGNTRSENLARKLRRKRERLRKKGLVELTFHTKPARLAADGVIAGDDPAVYGIVKDDDGDWVLTGLATTKSREVMARNDRTRRSRTKIQGRYLLTHTPNGTLPAAGVEIDRFDTKQAAMQYISADASNRVESGAYVVRSSHDPRRRREKVDQEAYQQFKRAARRVRD